MLEIQGEVIFIQIGSNEGPMRTDPLSALIKRGDWKGVLIEPVPKIFEKLKKNYAGRSNLFFENVAISDTRNIVDFYVVDEDAELLKNNPHWVNEIGGAWGDLVGSLDRDHLFRCKPVLSDKEIKTLQVQCVTLQDIVDKYRFERIDVIQMDAEGHDAVILQSIDFTRIKPKLILFEHAFMSFSTYMACIDYLQSYGYSVIHTSILDTVVGNPWIK